MGRSVCDKGEGEESECSKLGNAGNKEEMKGQADREGYGGRGLGSVTKAARESFDISTRIPTRDVCAELAADVCQRVLRFSRFSLSFSLSLSLSSC